MKNKPKPYFVFFFKNVLRFLNAMFFYLEMHHRLLQILSTYLTSLNAKVLLCNFPKQLGRHNSDVKLIYHLMFHFFVFSVLLQFITILSDSTKRLTKGWNSKCRFCLTVDIAYIDFNVVETVELVFLVLRI